MNVQSSSILMKDLASVCGGLAGSVGTLDQPARDRLVMDPENLADPSHPHPFEIELTGLLLEGWIFASSKCLKDPSAGSAKEVLETPAGP